MPRSRQKERQEKRKESPVLENIVPQSYNQELYFESLYHNPYTFAIGPPGTGKTFIALWHAIKMFLKGEVDKIVIVRPLVEVKNFDESKLGALPGDVNEKMSPWMGAIGDSLREVMSEENIRKVMNHVEFYNMALCRGRSFTNTFVIVDEAQNITIEGDGMKMLLTRLGRGSKMAIIGDLKQSDIGSKKGSALRDAIKKLHEEDGFGVCLLDCHDIVRNKYISRILEIYGDYNKNEPGITMEDILKEK